MVTLPSLPVLSRLVQRILQATQRTKQPHRKVRERRKERNRLQVKKLFSKQQQVTNGYWILPNYNDSPCCSN